MIINSLKGKIRRGVGGLYTVTVLDEQSEYYRQSVKCRARGIFRHNHLTPLPGDVVLLSYEDAQGENSDGGKFVIDEIIDRKNALIRPAMANLETLFVTIRSIFPALQSEIIRLKESRFFNDVPLIPSSA